MNLWSWPCNSVSETFALHVISLRWCVRCRGYGIETHYIQVTLDLYLWPWSRLFETFTLHSVSVNMYWNSTRIGQGVQEIWCRHNYCTYDLWRPNLALTLKHSVQNLCFACCLSEVDMCVNILTLNAPIATKVSAFFICWNVQEAFLANRVDPEFTLFASILNSSVILGNHLQQATSAENIFRCIFFLAL